MLLRYIMISLVWLFSLMLEHFKDTPSTFSKHSFFYFDQKSIPGLKKTNIQFNVVSCIYWNYYILSTYWWSAYNCSIIILSATELQTLKNVATLYRTVL